MICQIGLFLTGCSYERNLNSKYYCNKFKFNCLRENQEVLFKTSKGNFKVELNAENYPLTVANFVENIKKGIYVNQKFYKIISYPQIKFVHSGINPVKKDYLERNQTIDKLSPSIPLEIVLKRGLEPIYRNPIMDPVEISDSEILFERGSMAMVKSGVKDSSSTEFFFVTNKIPELDGRYSIFGKIVKGFEILEKLDKRDFIYEINISN